MSSMIEVLGTVGNAQTVVDVVGKCYKAFRVKRLESFANDCHTIFSDGEPFSEEKFREVFQGEFAQEHIHQFFHSLLETHSRVAQLAIAKLFTQAISRDVKYLTFKESTILKALQGLEDVEIEVLFLCFDVAYKVLDGAKHINTYKSEKNKFVFQFGSTDFEGSRTKFEALGIKSVNEIRSIVQRFFYSKIFSEKVNVIVNNYSDIWLSEGEEVAKEFMLLLEWARRVQN